MSIVLRTVVERDRSVLLEWRNADDVRAVSLDDGVITPDRHDAWFQRVLAGRGSADVRIVVHDQRPIGLVRLENVDEAHATGSWACHLGERRVPPGLGAALPVFGLALGFDVRGLRRMSADVLGHNSNMLAIHRRLGIEQEGVRRAAVLRSTGEEIDVHEFGVLRDEWPDVRNRLIQVLPRSTRDQVSGALAVLGQCPVASDDRSSRLER